MTARDMPVPRARLLVAVALVVLCVPLVGRAGACAGRAVDRWEALAVAAGTTQVAPLRETCALLAVDPGGVVRRGTGGTWTAVAAGVDTVWADPPTGLVVAAVRGGGVLVSGDDGRTFTTPAASGPVAGAVVAAAVSRGAAPVVVVATTAPAGALLWRSTDGGASFSPVGASPAPAGALAFDTWSADVLWLAAASGPAAGLWRSADAGTTWQRVLDGAAYDVATARGAASGLVLVARGDGLWRSADSAATWTRTPAPPLRAVRADGPGALALIGDAILRVPRSGPVTRLVAGLPTCAPHDLGGDGASPATFVVRCGTGWYVTVSGAGPGRSSGGPAERGLPVTGGALLPLTPLRQFPLPVNDATSTGSLAFDGHVLYYAGEFSPPRNSAVPIDRIHLMSPVDGHPLGILDPGMPAKFIGYDSGTDRLFVDDGRALWDVDRHTGRHRLLWTSNYGFQASYDPITRTFLAVRDVEGDTSMVAIDTRGRLSSQCSLAAAAAGAVTSAQERTPSAVVATADGAYVELEDDRTVLRVTRDCGLRAAYLTRTISESAKENDQVACDPMTFAPRTALWIRDSGPGTVTAYDLPAAYCPFVSRLDVAAPRSARDGSTVVICATVRGSARGEAIAGQAVALDVAGVALGAPPTGRDGRTCARAVLHGAGRAPVHARYPGTDQWTPAAATTVVRVVPVPAPRPARRTPPARDPAAVGATAVAGVTPSAPEAPGDPVHLPQSQPQPQHHPGQQPGTQAGAVPDTEDQPQLALAAASGDPAEIGTYAMSRRADPAVPVLGAALLTAIAVGWARRPRHAPARRVLRSGR